MAVVLFIKLILVWRAVVFISYAGRVETYLTQTGQGIRKLTPKNVRVHRESALHLALSKEWISRTSLNAPKLFAL